MIDCTVRLLRCQHGGTVPRREAQHTTPLALMKTRPGHEATNNRTCSNEMHYHLACSKLCRNARDLVFRLISANSSRAVRTMRTSTASVRSTARKASPSASLRSRVWSRAARRRHLRSNRIPTVFVQMRQGQHRQPTVRSRCRQLLRLSLASPPQPWNSTPRALPHRCRDQRRARTPRYKQR